jgi:hypothetical protein
VSFVRSFDTMATATASARGLTGVNARRGGPRPLARTPRAAVAAAAPRGAGRAW